MRPTLAELAASGLCAQVDPELFFPEQGGSSRDALRICAACPVRQACLEVAMEDGVSGIWGGTSHKQRKELGGRRELHLEWQPACGTEAGAKRHYRAGEPTCGPCRAAAASAARQREARAQGAA